MSTPSTLSRENRILTLDGWRGIALLLVLIDHTQAAFLGRYAAPWLQTGQHGVTIFFVLSGFLITSKLMEHPSLRDFYVRRVCRLMPAAWLYLLFITALHLTTGKDVLSCVLFFRNYGGQVLETGHYWSLSIEEQFYLVWPCLLMLAGFKRARWIALAGAVSCACYRFFYWHAYDKCWASFRTEVRIDAILLGCLLALVFPQVKSTCKRLVLPALIAFAICIALYHWLPPLFEDAAIAVLIAASVENPKGLLARITSFRPLVWLGVVSYSVYVWQQFFFLNRGVTITLSALSILPFFALGSYYFIERPLTRLGRRLTTRERSQIYAVAD